MRLFPRGQIYLTLSFCAVLFAADAVVAIETVSGLVIEELVLIGEHIAADGNSIAIVEKTTTGEQDVFSIGMDIFGKGKLLEVKENRLLIISNGTVRVVVNRKGLKSGVSESSIQASTHDADNLANNNSYKSATVNISENQPGLLSVELDRALVQKRWTEIPKMFVDSELEKVSRNGESIGYKLGKVPQESLLADLGLQNDDILKLVNNAPFEDPLQAVKEIYSERTTRNGLRLLVERGGVEQTVLVKFAQAQ